jgi:hypothetical protein
VQRLAALIFGIVLAMAASTAERRAPDSVAAPENSVIDWARYRVDGKLSLRGDCQGLCICTVLITFIINPV